MTKREHISFLGMLFLVFVPSSPIHVKAMHQIEQALTKNSWTGAGVSILSSVLAKTSLLAAPVTGWKDNVISLASDVGIIVGLLIGCLTLVLKAKEFYKEFIYAGKKPGGPTVPTKETVPPPADNDREGMV